MSCWTVKRPQITHFGRGEGVSCVTFKGTADFLVAVFGMWTCSAHKQGSEVHSSDRCVAFPTHCTILQHFELMMYSNSKYGEEHTIPHVRLSQHFECFMLDEGQRGLTCQPHKVREGTILHDHGSNIGKPQPLWISLLVGREAGHPTTAGHSGRVLVTRKLLVCFCYPSKSTAQVVPNK